MATPIAGMLKTSATSVQPLSPCPIFQALHVKAAENPTLSTRRTSNSAQFGQSRIRPVPFFVKKGSDPDDLVFRDDEDLVAAARRDDGATGEGAEGGQHAVARREPEARQAQGLAVSREAHGRMDVAGERVAAP